MARNTIPGTSGNDVVNLENDGTTIDFRAGEGEDQIRSTASTAVLSSSFVNLNTGRDIVSLGAGANSSTLHGGRGADTIVTGALNAARFNANKGVDNVTLNDGATNSSVFGGQGTDTLVMNGAYSSSKVQGDNEADTITFANGSSIAGSTINGNLGNDTINVNAITAFSTSTVFGGQGNDSINAGASTVGVFTSGDAGDDTFAGGTGNDTIIAGIGADNIQGGNGADSMLGGHGDDFLVYEGTAQATGDVFDAGDNLQTNGDAILVQTADTDFTNLTTATILTAGGVERIQIQTGRVATFTGAQLTGQGININGAGAAGASTLQIDATATTAVDLSNLTFGAVGSGTAFTAGTDVVRTTSAAGTNTTITGTTLNNSLNGNTGADTITGNTGNDTITGGTNADSLSVSTGTDHVVVGSGDISATNFGAGAAALAAVGDIITGLTDAAAADKLNLDVTGFTGGALANLTVNAAANLAAAGAIVTTGGGVLLHNALMAAEAIDSGAINATFITQALGVIMTAGAGTNSATTSDSYVAIAGARAGGVAGTEDLGIFKIDHAAGSANIGATEVTFVGVIENFGAALTNGFII